MIEQTEMIVTTWKMYPTETGTANLSNHTVLEVMKKRAPTKKGIACRLTCHFKNGEDPVLDYIAEHSYVIDPEDVIDRKEMLSMIRNSFASFDEKFEFRKLGTVLQDAHLMQLDETVIEVDAILPLLV